MTDKVEQRTCIKFCVKLSKTPSETLEMLRQAYGSDCLSRTSVFEWHSRFKSGRESVDDNWRSGRPVTSKTDDNVDKVRDVIHEDRRRTIRQISEMIGIGYGVCQEILTEDLNMRRVAAKFVPRILTAEQKQRRVDVCEELLEAVKDDSTFLSRVITADESWIYGYDPETKQQSSQWKSPQSPRPQKAKQFRSATKTMLIAFFDVKGIVHREFVSKGMTVNSDFYCDVLRRLRESVRRKRPELWKNRNWLLHQDNAPPHVSLKTTQFLTDHNMTTVPHPPYSPDIAPCDFSLFPKLKLRLRGRRFQSVDDIQAATDVVLKSFDSSFFLETFEEWKRRWNRCSRAGGEYFEGDDSRLFEDL